MADESGAFLSTGAVPVAIAAPQDLAARLDRIEGSVAALAQRLEEAIAYFAIRSNRVANSQSIYLGDDTAVTFMEDGLRILVDTRSLDIGIHLLTLGLWEPAYTNLFRRLLRPGDTVLDLGANHGVYALMAAVAVGPAGRVHAFEPNPRLARLVEMSIRMNGLSDIATLHRAAASDAPGSARLVFTDSYSGGGSLSAREGVATQGGDVATGVDCKLVVLDEMFPDPAFRANVIKMDVEGFEGRVLRGMRGILERSPDVRMMMEFGPEMMASSGVPPAEVAALLQGLGLSAWTIDHESRLHETPWETLAEARHGLQNILVAREAPV